MCPRPALPSEGGGELRFVAGVTPSSQPRLSVRQTYLFILSGIAAQDVYSCRVFFILQTSILN